MSDEASVDHDAEESLGLRELAARLGLCERQVRTLARRGLPRLAPSGGRDRYGRFPWPEARDWYQRFRVVALAERQEAARRGHAAAVARRKTARARHAPTPSNP